jgi:hypothetical protein
MILSTLLTAKTAAAVLGAGALVVGGTAAAYAGVLPSSLQSVAHAVVGAPAGQNDQGDDDATESPKTSESPEATESPKADDTAGSTESPDPSTSPSAQGPDATGPAAKGLCTAHSHGGLPDHSTAGKALIAAAGTSTVDDYCATVLNPSATPTTSPSESSSTDTSAAPTTTTTHGKSQAAKHAKAKHGHGRPASLPAR